MRLIDADALMQKVNERYHDPFFDICVRNAPTVPPESLVKRGRWEEEPCNHKPYRVKNLDKWVVFRCSECGHSNGRKKSNFCGNCGAKMVED